MAKENDEDWAELRGIAGKSHDRRHPLTRDINYGIYY